MRQTHVEAASVADPGHAAVLAGVRGIGGTLPVQRGGPSHGDGSHGDGSYGDGPQ